MPDFSTIVAPYFVLMNYATLDVETDCKLIVAKLTDAKEVMFKPIN